MKRYKLQDKVKFGIACEIGEWVKYSEAKGIIEKKDIEIMELKTKSNYWCRMWKECNEV